MIELNAAHAQAPESNSRTSRHAPLIERSIISQGLYIDEACVRLMSSQNPLVQEVLEKCKPIWALDHAAGLLEWDLETYMPEDASKPRGFAFAQLALMKQERIKDAAGLVSKAQNLDGLSDIHDALVFLSRLLE